MKPLTNRSFLLAYGIHFLLVGLIIVGFAEIGFHTVIPHLDRTRFWHRCVGVLYVLSWFVIPLCYFAFWGKWNAQAQHIQISASTYHDQISWRYRFARFLFPNYEE